MSSDRTPIEMEDDDDSGSNFDQSSSFFVRALYEFQATDASSLSFKEGALIEVLTQLESGWWDGLLSNDVRGWFPSNYVQRISDEEAEAQLQAEQELNHKQSATSSSLNASTFDSDAAEDFTTESSTQAAEAALLAMQHMHNNGSATSDSQYAGLGLGQDFDALRKLMNGMSTSSTSPAAAAPLHGGADSFDHLDGGGNGSMTDSASRDSKSTINLQQLQQRARAGSGNDHRLGVLDTRRRSRMSDQSSQIDSSLATTNSTSHSNFSQTDISSMPARSNAASLSETDGSRKAAQFAADAAANAVLATGRSDSPEKERIRAHTVSVQRNSSEDQAYTLAGRPRAQTTHNTVPSANYPNADAGNTLPTSPMNERSTARSKRQSQATSGSLSKRSSRDADSFWVPKVNERGEIFYLNTRTGQRARDLPDGAAFGANGADDEINASAPGSDVEERMQDVGTSTLHGARRSGGGGGAAFPGGLTTNRRGSATTPGNHTPESRPSTASSSVYAAATKHQRRNAIDAIPDARDVPWPWTVRINEDEKTFYLYNRQTNEICADVETILSSSPHGTQSRASAASASTRMRNGRSTSTVRREEVAKAVGTVPNASLRYPDEQEAFSLQRAMAQVPSAPKSLSQMIEEAGDAIATLAAISSEPIGSDGLSEEDAKVTTVQSDSLHDTSRLSFAIVDVIRAVRDLLHASGALSVASVDMASAAHGMQQFFDGSGASSAKTAASAAFQSCIIALQCTNQDMRDMSPCVTAAHALAVASTPQSLLPLGKKINATLSKLVLSARSVIEQSCLNAEQRPAFSEAQLEKILGYRQRIRDDSMELARALGAFGSEAVRSRRAADAGVNAWMRRNTAHLQSASGVAGIGMAVYGGGAAAGWRGHGFVLPSATEAAALRAEAQGAYQNPFELTREAREAIASGKVALRRKPTLMLTEALLNATISPKISQLSRYLTEMSELFDSSPDHQTSAYALLRITHAICAQFGALLTVLEEIDLALTVDVDGPHPAAVKRNGEQLDEYMRSVLRARELLHTFVNVKQATYDGSSLLLLHVQEAVDAYVFRPNNEGGVRLNQQTTALLDGLSIVARQLRATLMYLLEVMDAQRKQQQQNNDIQGSIGARAKVYGIDDVKLKMTEGKAESEDVIYLGPGLAVPNGPSGAANRTNMAPPPLQLSTTTLSTIPPTTNETKNVVASTPSSLKTMFQRGRSATNASLMGADGVESGSRSLTGSGKLRRDTVEGGLSAATSLHDGASAEGVDATSTISANNGKQVEEVPWFLQADTPPNDIVLNANGQVKGATLPALMERLTMHNAFDASFNTTFLMTYRSFTTTEEFMDMLFERFRIVEPLGLTNDELEMWVERKQRPIRFRVLNVLKSWIETQYHEDEDEIHIQRIKDFAMSEMVHAPAMGTSVTLLLRILERRHGIGEQLRITMVMPGSAPATILPKNFRKIKFLDIDPLEMARQLTLMDSRLYNRIRPAECLDQAWNRPNASEIARGIRDVISANNRVSGWVSEAILVQEDVKKRAAWVKQFVAIADKCYLLNNFSSMMAISSGLNNASLSRLRRTWDAVNQRHLQLFENIRTIWAPTRNFSKYRETLRKLNPPCVPFLGVYLTDLTFIEEGNSDRMRTDERLINFGKRQMTAEKIQEIMIYQSTPYNFTPVPGIQKFIEENLIEARGEDELFEQSLRLEPREREDEKIARLLQESGFL